ncbi:MAG TPA: hypothetical protein VGD41_01875, partial [Pyrinomonadaceae bacterium]
LAKHLWAIATSRGWDKLLTSEEVRPTGIKLLINVLLLLAPFALGVSRIWHFATHQRSYETIRNPVAAVEFLKAKGLPQPIYNRYGWGGYLIYELYPSYRVYIDGRADVYGDAFFAESVKIYDGLDDGKNSFDRYGIKTVLIAHDAALATRLKTDSNWKVVYEDDQAIIFTRL